jgi:hypothetical protein
MKLLEKYLQTVRFFLPGRNQDDIIRELSENLLSQMEDREAELGRELTEDEQADILRRHGHPMVVASSYRSHQRLIGPLFFPLYLLVLKVGLGVAGIVTVVLTAISAAMSSDVPRQVVQGLLAYPGRALMVFAWTTLGFAVLDYAQSRLKITHKWDPRTLPDVPRRQEWSRRGEALCELIASSAGVVWLLLVPSTPVLLIGPAAAFLSFAPIWAQMYVPMLAVMIAHMGVTLSAFIRPYWTPTRSLLRVGIQTASAIVFMLVLRAGEWFVLKPASVEAAAGGGASLEHIAQIINMGFQIGLTIAVIAALIEAARELYRYASRRGTPLARVQNSLL